MTDVTGRWSARAAAALVWATFDYEAETHSIVVIQGVRERWNPEPVRVEVRGVGFFDHAAFAGAPPVLASAFHVAGVAYRWERGRREALPRAAR